MVIKTLIATGERGSLRLARDQGRQDGWQTLFGPAKIAKQRP